MYHVLAMAPTVQLAKPIRFERLTRLLRIRGVNVFVHWSIFVIAGVMVLASIKQPWVTLAAGLSWLGLLLLHETGHAIMAQRKGCRATAIYLYPIHGLCCFEAPWSRFDHCLIAWGGVLAQLLVAVPLVAGVA